MKSIHIHIIHFPLTGVLLAAVFLLGAVLSPAHAAKHQAGAVTLDQARAVVAAASGNRGTATSIFDGPDGLHGVIVSIDGREVVTWLTPNGQALLVDGLLLGADGANLSEAALIQQGLMLSPTDALKAASDPASRAFVVGKSGPVVTAFMDPNCIFCHRFYQAIQPEVEAGRVRVRYVMVGTLKPTSIPRAASIIAAKDPAAALNEDESKFDERTEEGGYVPDAQLDPAAKAAVEANNALFTKAGAHGTPAMLVCSKEAGTVKLIEGLPADIQAFIADVDSKADKLCR